jgi:hypothetical protein
MSDCPKCCNAAEFIEVCDNDCGTVSCPDCDTEWHLDPTDNSVLLGHHPDCGGASSDEENDTGEVAPMDLSE